MSSLVVAVGSVVVFLLWLAGLLAPKTLHIKEWAEWVMVSWFAIVLLVVAPFRVWKNEREKVGEFEEAAQPRLEISDPLEGVEPKGIQGKGFRKWTLKITNVSTATVRQCYAKKKSFINRNGHQSQSIGLRFKWGGDHPKILGNYSYLQSFDIPPGGHEYVDIACMEEREEKDPRVFMLYAIPGEPGSAAIGNAISPIAFPHRLVVQFCADNIQHPIERTYDLSVDKSGSLRMVEVPFAV